jgi:hypothetical protein
MSPRSRTVLLTLLAAATAGAQDVSVTSTTLAQMWKQDTPGFSKASYLPATEFLGIDASRVGTDALSLHFFGWGTTDLQDASSLGGKNRGNLTYGYAQYDFAQANAQIKAGRFSINQGVGMEVVDGIAARTDLKHGFYVSGFFGAPVVFKNESGDNQRDVAFQRDIIVGARLGWRFAMMGEVGVDFLQEGSQAAKDIPQTPDYTRRQLGVDLKIAPWSFMDVSGRTVFNIANRPDALPGEKNSDIAEHDYAATFRLHPTLALTGTYVERNFNAYYAGTTLPSLFNIHEKGALKTTGATLTWTPVDGLQILPDYKRIERDLYGTTNRAGLDLRYHFTASHVLAGMGYHAIKAFDVVAVDAFTPSFSLSHQEARAWAMYENGALALSLDAIQFHYQDADLNPNLKGKNSESQVVGSVGYQFLANLKLSADLSVQSSPLYGRQTMGLLRLDYRFGFAGKGGK